MLIDALGVYERVSRGVAVGDGSVFMQMSSDGTSVWDATSGGRPVQPAPSPPPWERRLLNQTLDE